MREEVAEADFMKWVKELAGGCAFGWCTPQPHDYLHTLAQRFLRTQGLKVCDVCKGLCVVYPSEEKCKLCKGKGAVKI